MKDWLKAAKDIALLGIKVLSVSYFAGIGLALGVLTGFRVDGIAQLLGRMVNP